MRSVRIVRMALAAFVVIGMANNACAQVPSASGSPLKTGQKISLDLKGVDILDVLKLLSQKSGLNFVAGRNVSGRVTIFVNNVDVWDAFELIIGANDLAYERHGDIVTVMMARDYELLFGEKFQERKESFVAPLKYAKVVQVATVFNQIKSSVGRVVADEGTNTLIITDVPGQLQQMRELIKQLDRPVETRLYSLNYAEAEKMKEKVQEILSPVGTFTFDPRTNQAIVSDLEESLGKIDRLIRAFDTPDRQVLIEAQIVTVTLNESNSLGIDWQRVFSGVDTTMRSNLLTRGNVIGGDVIGGTSTGTALQLLSSDSNSKLLIEALKTIGNTETLSNPRIMVSNNQEAKILVGTKEVFITTTTTVPATGSTVTAPEIKTEEVGTKLFVTPNIKRDGHIQLKIRPEVSSVKDTITKVANTIVPIIQTTEAETNVLVKSGVTLVIGGLIDTKNTKTDNSVPGLGDIPLLGFPFRGKAQERKKTELVVFLTPRIISPDGSAYVPPKEEDGISEKLLPEVKLRPPVPEAYRSIVRERLERQLSSQFRESSLQRGSVVVSFILNHDGSLVDVEEISSAQGEQFVMAAKEALNRAQPFPPFPEGSDADQVRFRLAVDYSP